MTACLAIVCHYQPSEVMLFLLCAFIDHCHYAMQSRSGLPKLDSESTSVALLTSPRWPCLFLLQICHPGAYAFCAVVCRTEQLPFILI